MSDIDKHDSRRFLDRWGGTLAVTVCIVALALSVFGSMFAG